MSKIIYDTAKTTDLDDIMFVENSSFEPDERLSQASMLERIHLIPERFLVARNEMGKVIGMVMGPTSNHPYLLDEMFEETQVSLTTDPTQIIVSLAVSADYRGLGIATSLLDNLVSLARKEKRQSIALTCLARLIPYYERYGFVNKGKSQSQLAGETWYNMTFSL